MSLQWAAESSVESIHLFERLADRWIKVDHQVLNSCSISPTPDVSLKMQYPVAFQELDESFPVSFGPLPVLNVTVWHPPMEKDVEGDCYSLSMVDSAPMQLGQTRPTTHMPPVPPPVSIISKDDFDNNGHINSSLCQHATIYGHEQHSYLMQSYRRPLDNK